MHQEPEAVRSQSNSSASLGTLGPRTPFPASPWVPVRLSRLQPGTLGRAGRLPGLELRSPRLSEQHGRLKSHLGPLSRREPGAAVCSASVTVSVGWGGTSQRGHAELLRRLPVRARESSGPGSVPSSSYSESWKVAFLKWLIPAWELGMFSPAVLMSLLGGRLALPGPSLASPSSCTGCLLFLVPVGMAPTGSPLRWRRESNLHVPPRSRARCNNCQCLSYLMKFP